mmetsp:Transcript_890/g.1907  ORF Transcript_890/g.1907 Transcript_890/m.1907 type:complete len:569 (-) Transcript_890:116-1822(-)
MDSVDGSKTRFRLGAKRVEGDRRDWTNHASSASHNHRERYPIDDPDDGTDSNDKRPRKRSRGRIAIPFTIAMLIVILTVENLCKERVQLERTEAIATMKKNQCGTSHLRIPGRRNRRVVLLGPHDRYHDFGDILAERIISKLLVDRAGYVFNQTDDRKNTVLLGGIVTRDDMDRHGLTPQKTIYGMKSIQAMSRADFSNGPYDIVYTGGGGARAGPISYEEYSDAVKLLETEELRAQATADKVFDCPYLFPKQLLMTVVNRTMATNVRNHAKGQILTLPRPKRNYAISDSLEHPSTKRDLSNKPRLSCRQALAAADHVRFRDDDPLAPDSAFLTRELFGEEIEQLFETTVRNDLYDLGAWLRHDEEPNYVAVQHGKMSQRPDSSYIEDMARGLDEVSRSTGNATVVFFSAGSIDSVDRISRRVMQKMTQPSLHYPTEHALEVVALLSKARAVIGTNLHVRIISLVYQKPRATWFGSTRHQRFLELWEAPDVAARGTLSSVRDVWNEGLRRFFPPENDGGEFAGFISANQTLDTYHSAVRQYLDNFDQWSNLLVTPTENGEDDDDDCID